MALPLWNKCLHYLFPLCLEIAPTRKLANINRSGFSTIIIEAGFVVPFGFETLWTSSSSFFSTQSCVFLFWVRCFSLPSSFLSPKIAVLQRRKHACLFENGWKYIFLFFSHTAWLLCLHGPMFMDHQYSLRRQLAFVRFASYGETSRHKQTDGQTDQQKAGADVSTTVVMSCRLRARSRFKRCRRRRCCCVRQQQLCPWKFERHINWIKTAFELFGKTHPGWRYQ